MTLSEKIGQMTQADVKSLRPGAVRELGLGSVLSGGGGNPTPNNPRAWADMVRHVQQEALDSRLGIPLLYGVDATHGHNNVRGATIFPHSIGLGASRDAGLVERIGEITARELRATNVHWAFAPAVSVPQDTRWGRTYEAFGHDPELVASLAAAFIRGLNRGPVLSSPKHFVGDGGTSWGTTRRYEWIPGPWTSDVPDRWQIDQGDLVADEADLRAVHLRPYIAAIAAGAQSIMVSYSSWNGQKLHGHRYLLSDVLKGELGFSGFVVSDWLAVSQLDHDFVNAVCTAVNAGIDMVMVPFEYERFIGAVLAGVASRAIPASRIDDACRRILGVKAALNLFAQPFGDESLLAEVGSPAHRAVAREAVSKSQVLLRNEAGALPLRSDVPKLLVAGEAADDIGLQCGGWTIEWQGAGGPITPGTTLLQAIRAANSPSTSVVYEAGGRFSVHGDVGIAVVGEEPYAEGEGDAYDLSLRAAQVDLVRRVRSCCEVLIVVVYSGRPLLLGDVVDLADAIVASWLPGTEAQGIADVLYGIEPFTARLPHPWPDLDRAQEGLWTAAGEPEDVAAGR